MTSYRYTDQVKARRHSKVDSWILMIDVTDPMNRPLFFSILNLDLKKVLICIKFNEDEKIIAV